MVQRLAEESLAPDEHRAWAVTMVSGLSQGTDRITYPLRVSRKFKKSLDKMWGADKVDDMLQEALKLGLEEVGRQMIQKYFGTGERGYDQYKAAYQTMMAKLKVDQREMCKKCQNKDCVDREFMMHEGTVH